MWHQFKATENSRLSLYQSTLFCQKLPADFKEELVALQKHVTGLDK
jgi:hypothetical protein